MWKTRPTASRKLGSGPGPCGSVGSRIVHQEVAKLWIPGQAHAGLQG